MEKRTAGIVARGARVTRLRGQAGHRQDGCQWGFCATEKGSTVLYRADMDANAVEEMTGLPYASEVRVKREDGGEVPVAHMCGHDAHVAWMLGVAKAHGGRQSGMEWNAGDGGPTGRGAARGRSGHDRRRSLRRSMACRDTGFHVGPSHGTSRARWQGSSNVGRCPNGWHRSNRRNVPWRIGGHGSSPQFAKDPVLMAAMAVVQYQAIISRIIDPQKAAVLTVGSIQAGTDNNVIPSTALVKINLRWFSETVREQMINGIRAISESIARAYGLPDDMMPTHGDEGQLRRHWSTTMPLWSKRLHAPPGSSWWVRSNMVTEFPDDHRFGRRTLALGRAQQNVPLAYLVVGRGGPGSVRQGG